MHGRRKKLLEWSLGFQFGRVSRLLIPGRETEAKNEGGGARRNYVICSV